jgi:hypothetical protein
MTKPRTPRDAPLGFTPEILEIFRKMKSCATDDEWWDLHDQMHKELRGKPWQWPIISEPGAADFECAEAEALWRELEAASAEG